MFQRTPARWAVRLLALALPLAVACQRETPVEPNDASGGRPTLFRPQEWTFTGRAFVGDPSGFPLGGVGVRLTAASAYDVRWDPEQGGPTWSTEYCSASGQTDAHGEVFLRCSIPDRFVERIDHVQLSIADSRYTVVRREEVERTAMDVSERYFIIRDDDHNNIGDDIELPLARKFAPRLVLTAGDGGARPVPVEIFDRNDDDRLGWEDVSVSVYNLAGYSLGEFHLNEIIFLSGDAYTGEYRYPYLMMVMKDYIIPGFDIVGSHVEPWNPPGIYILVPHFEWDPPGQTNPESWYTAWNSAIAEHANDSRYTAGTTYAALFRSGPEVVIQYWFFYPFNNSGNRHEGDWEHINVVLDSDSPLSAQIARVEYYYHNKVAVARAAGTDYQLADGTHPLVYVGGYTEGCRLHGSGTHASYPRPGTHDNINPVGSSERVGGDGLQIDFDGYRNIVLLPNEIPRTVYAADPGSTYAIGWQHFAGFWGHPLSKPLACGAELDFASWFLTGIVSDLPIGVPWAIGATFVIQRLAAELKDRALEDINFAPPGPRFNSRWHTTEK